MDEDEELRSEQVVALIMKDIFDRGYIFKAGHESLEPIVRRETAQRTQQWRLRMSVRRIVVV